MILGEVGVIIFIFLIGMYFINWAYNKEMEAVWQQWNFLLLIIYELKLLIVFICLVLEIFQCCSLLLEKIEWFICSVLFEMECFNGLVSDLLLFVCFEVVYKFYEEVLDLLQILEDLIEILDFKYLDVWFYFDK